MSPRPLFFSALFASFLVWPGAPAAVGSPAREGLERSPDRAVTLTGRITDGATGAPLSGVQISEENGSFGGLTDRKGTYLLLLGDEWVGREAILVARHLGYGTARRTVRVAAGSNTLDFALRMEAREVEASAVTPYPTLAHGRRKDAAVFQSAGYPAPAFFFEGGRRPAFNTESYAFIRENGFLSAAANPLSTFSIDVDRASYANVRRFIHDGVRPPVDAVRIEELINYFPYTDAAPGRGEAPLTVHTEVGVAPWQPLHRLVRIALKARSVDMREAPPSNLVFLIDVSGSMATPDKLPLLKTAFGMLVDQLRPRDRVAVVVYAGAAGLVLPSTPGSDREAILDALHRLEAGGSTAGGAGIRLAYEVARENHIRGGNNRVILATDGDFNVGASSDAEMIRLIEEKRAQATYLTVLGFGTGNLKDSKMEQIADHGNGNFAYIDNALEAKKVLVNEMGGTLLTVAKDVKLQVEFNPARVAAYRLIGYENRLLAAEDFRDDTKDAGELGAGHSVPYCAPY